MRLVGHDILRRRRQVPVVTFLSALTSAGGAANRNDYPDVVGFRFQAQAALTVHALGRWKHAGNSQSHTVGIWTDAGVAVSGASVTVNAALGANGAYQYTDLAAPVALAAGAHYYIGSLEFSGGDLWTNEAAVIPSSGIVVTHSAYRAGGSWFTNLGGSLAFGHPNFRYVQ